MIELGDKVKDSISPFGGIVVAEIKYMNGCKRYQIQREKLEGGKIITEWIDEEQLIITSKAKVEPVLKQRKKDPGGPGDVPSFSLP